MEYYNRIFVAFFICDVLSIFTVFLTLPSITFPIIIIACSSCCMSHISMHHFLCRPSPFNTMLKRLQPEKLLIGKILAARLNKNTKCTRLVSGTSSSFSSSVKIWKFLGWRVGSEAGRLGLNLWGRTWICFFWIKNGCVGELKQGQTYNHHHHHHLFLKHPFLPRLARVRRSPRYEASLHIPEHCPFRVQTKLIRIIFYTFSPSLPAPTRTSHPHHHHISTGWHPIISFLTFHMLKPPQSTTYSIVMKKLMF